MKFYVAAKFERYMDVRGAISRLKQNGHEITYDWTHHAESSPEKRKNIEYMAECAALDMQGVRDCDALLLLADHPDLAGAWVEMGGAIALNKPVFVVAPVRDCVFLHLTFVLETVDEAMSSIEAYCHQNLLR